MLKEIVVEFKRIYKEELGVDFPDDVWEQLGQAIEAVFNSWFGERAATYRRYNKIPDTGAPPSTSAPWSLATWARIRAPAWPLRATPAPAKSSSTASTWSMPRARTWWPAPARRSRSPSWRGCNKAIYDQFIQVANMLESHYRDMQDMEFTVEKGKLWMLQTPQRQAHGARVDQDRRGHGQRGADQQGRGAHARRTDQVDVLLHPSFDEKAKQAATARGDLITKGLNASPGAATGVAVFSAAEAVRRAELGEAVVLVRPETSPDDVGGMLASKGVLTQHGGATSHAAVVARGSNLPCVVGCEDITVIGRASQLYQGRAHDRGGRYHLHRRHHGRGLCGAIPTTDLDFGKEQDLSALLGWADETRRLGVYTNADYPRDALRARELGAEGIGLCRTEHMFFEKERRPSVVGMIMARTDEDRAKYPG